MKFMVSKAPFIKQQWHWVLVADNGEVVATSENYANKVDALSTIRSIMSHVSGATIEEVS